MFTQHIQEKFRKKIADIINFPFLKENSIVIVAEKKRKRNTKYLCDEEKKTCVTHSWEMKKREKKNIFNMPVMKI